jgi:hypothetical protein
MNDHKIGVSMVHTLVKGAEDAKPMLPWKHSLQHIVRLFCSVKSSS